MQSLSRSSLGLDLSATERTRIVLAHSSAAASLGAVTIVNNYLTTAGAIDVTVSQSGGQMGTLDGLPSGTYTSPQILPVGVYSVEITSAASGAVIATTLLTVSGGMDASAVASPNGASPSGGTLTMYTDSVSSVPVGANIVSVRNTLTPLQNFYVNGHEVASSVANGQSMDLAEPSGTYSIGVSPAGGPGSGSIQTLGSLVLSQDAYVPVYAVSDPAVHPLTTVLTATAFTRGYQFTAADGGVFNFGAYPFNGSTGGSRLNAPVVGGAESTTGAGYWLVASDGGVFSFGAPFTGSLGGTHLNAPIVGMAAVVGSNGKPGYLLAAKDGGVFAFNANFYGSLGATNLTSPVVGISADPQTGGYILAEANGTVTAFGPGAAPVVSSVGPLSAPIVALTATPDGGGAWLVGSDGSVFALGDAGEYGSAVGAPLNQPVVGIQATYDGLGYELIARDGGVFTYGNAHFFGSTGGTHLNEPVVGAVG